MKLRGNKTRYSATELEAPAVVESMLLHSLFFMELLLQYWLTSFPLLHAIQCFYSILARIWQWKRWQTQ